ncbi:MAG: MBG domain-containing protein [Cytophagales bacterium]
MRNFTTMTTYLSKNRIFRHFFTLLPIVLTIFKVNSIGLNENSRPTIVDFFPKSGIAGSTISITGTNLSNVTFVGFNSAISNQIISDLSISILNPSLMVVAIPLNIKSGIITIGGNGGIFESASAFIYEKMSPTISGLNLSNQYLEYGFDPILVTTTNATLPLRLSYKSTPSTGVLTIVGNAIKGIGVGTATITGYQIENANFTGTTVVGTIDIRKSDLFIYIASKSRLYGEENPAFNGIVIGLKNNEYISIQYNTKANNSSPVGEYPIDAIIEGEVLKNYELITLPGVLTINKANQTIIIPKIKDYEIGSFAGYITLVDIYSSSGLPIQLSVTGRASLEFYNEGVAVVRVDTAGKITIIGTQEGNGNYNPAPAIVQIVDISTTAPIHSSITGTLIPKAIEDITAYPNPNNGSFYVDSPIATQIEILNCLGEMEGSITTTRLNQLINIEKKGMYLLNLKVGNTQKRVKIVVQ